MYYCEELKNLSVLSLYEGELIGKVDKLYFDKNLKKLIEIGIVGENGTTMFLLVKDIYRVGKNAITVKNNQAINLKENSESKILAPIGSKVYSINGEFLGIVKEIKLNEKFFSEKIILENDQLVEVNRFASCGKNTLIIHDSNKKNIMKNLEPTKSPKVFKGEEVEAQILPTEKENPQVVSVEESRQAAIQNSDFLIGRVCMKDIVNFNNELLIKKNGTINKKNLKEIIKFGKLRELMLFIK